jgi:plasmid stabilization system protein ParE
VGHIRWTQEALRWLREIRNHIARDNPEAARRTAAGILDRVEVLRSFPQIGQRYEGVTHREVRILLYGHYRIAYLVTEDRDVKLLGIFHGALDIDRYLG